MQGFNLSDINILLSGSVGALQIRILTTMVTMKQAAYGLLEGGKTSSQDEALSRYSASGEVPR